MGLRDFLREEARTTLTEPVDARFELPALAVQDESKPTVFETVGEYPNVRAVANTLGSREMIGRALDVEPSAIVDAMGSAMNDPLPVEKTAEPSFEHVASEPTIDDHVPIPVFYDEHERQYFASSVVISKDPETGVQNASFHRMMFDSGNRLVMRLVERHLHDIYSRTEGGLEVAIVMGVHPAVELAAATSFAPEKSELALANRLLDGTFATTEVDGIDVPADAEIVMRPTITDERSEEGPFVDLSRTWDRTRQQPVVEVADLYMRPDPYARIIVPGRTEHAHLMGIPQEPRIYRIVENTVPTVENVVLTPGGCSWLHGVVQLDKRSEGDPKNAGMAALAGHPSMKKVTVVDSDIDPADPQSVEWATATRMQPDEDITVIENAKGSSLDPSQDYDRGTLAKWIVDATVPGDRDRSDFAEVTVPKAEEIDLTDYQ
ncbi:UbiD family decarboxylase [Halorhabdus salina]|uniref:UbiD family decarboxylase n=1 Tax=Halorhabdus salina TaxID=2750670 RepID=UPI0015EEDC77|nr:UbiD family decarboxylase [Halorhabdus salina]